MAIHNINLQLTTQQVLHLNDSLNESYRCNMEAIDSIGFEDEVPTLQKQCEALQTFIESIKEVVEGAENA